jgi:hypothetical protein
MPHVRAATALIGFLFVSAALAAPFAVQVGEARIGLDAPPGFADTTFTGSPRLQELAESLTSPSNRILLFAISDGDLRKFTLGDPLELRRSMIAVTSKELERQHVSSQRFAQISAAALPRAGTQPPAGAELAEHIARQPPGQPAVLGELRREADVVSLLMGERGAPAARSQKAPYVLSSNTFMLLRGKALQFVVFTLYESPADVDWVRSITARWIDDLRRLNSR